MARIFNLSQSPVHVWMGTDESFRQVEQASARLAALEAQGPQALQAKIAEMRGGMQSDDPYGLPPLYTVTDGVAVLELNGPLVMGSAGFMRLFGVLGYDDIRQAAMSALADGSVKSILMVVGSGGGHASGCEDCATTLEMVGEQKPLITFTDTIMGSAAYWIGSKGRKILASATATLGSVGVIIVHTEYSKRDAQEGVTRNVIRAGEFKQLANAVEALSPEGRAHLTEMGEQMYAIFRSHIATSLNVSEEKFDATMGRGREFLGARAVEVGLAHELSSYDQAFAYAKSVDSSKKGLQNSRKPLKDSKMKATLATALILQLVAGVKPAELNLSTPAATLEGVQPDAEAATFLRAQAIELSAGIAEAQAKVVAAALTPVQAELATAKAELTTATTELASLKTTSTALNEKVQSQDVALKATESITLSSLTAMMTALNMGKPDDKLAGPELLAKHNEVAASFAAKFPSARVSAVTTAVEDKTKTAVQPGQLPDFARIALANRATK